MGLPETLVAKLSNSTVGTLVNQRINAAIGTTGTQVPFVTFTVTNIESSFTLDGAASALEKTTVQFDVWGTKHTQITQILSTLRSVLSGWREGQVKWCVWNTQAIEQDEDSEHYHGVSEFTIWYERNQRIRAFGIESGEAFGTPELTEQNYTQRWWFIFLYSTECYSVRGIPQRCSECRA